MPRLLLTGFAPFLSHPVNPSAQLAEALDGTTVAGYRVTGVQLPVSYAGTAAAFRDAVARVVPDAVILTGLAFETDAIRLERVALNLDDTHHPDNDGTVRRGIPIAADGPVGYWSILPLAAMAMKLESAAIPVTFSRDAGGYLCNHLFFQARHLLAATAPSVPAGFVHVPPLPEQIAARPDSPPGRTGMTLVQLLTAATLMIQALAEVAEPVSA